MSDLTFQYGCSTPLETFEWDRMWLEHTEDLETPRVLYVGDSISCGVLGTANKRAAGRLRFDGFHTSKGLDNPHFRTTLLAIAAQQPRRDLIILNNGLHGWHLDDAGEYIPWLRDTLCFLQEQFPKTPVAFVQTTHVTHERWQVRARQRALLAATLIEELQIPMIDLYAPSLAHADLIKDGVHFTEEGYALLADALIARVTEILE